MIVFFFYLNFNLNIYVKNTNNIFYVKKFQNLSCIVCCRCACSSNYLPQEVLVIHTYFSSLTTIFNGIENFYKV